MADGDREYLTKDGDMLDLIAYLEYGTSSEATEMLYDYNYRVADRSAPMQAGVKILLPPYTPPKQTAPVKLWG